MKIKISQLVFIIAALATLTPWVTSGFALVLGICVAIVFGNPFATKTKNITSPLLSFAVIGLGAGMNLNVVARVGVEGIGYTVVGILVTALLGTFLGKLLNTAKDTSILITVGTAICGGSAIAAVAPVIKAKNEDVSVALGTVFLLNSVALLIFPFIGHHFNLSQSQFGLWGALAIHDTSSVVGATLQYGSSALKIGTTIKLARALWIVPVTLFIGYLYSSEAKPKRPWFIGGFLIVAAIVTWIPSLQGAGVVVEQVAKKLMVLTLFLIGSNLSPATLKAVGLRPFVQGVCLWITVASLTLFFIYFQWIQTFSA